VKKTKLRESLKSLVILLLAVSAVFLAYESRVFHEFVSGSAWLSSLAERFGAEPPAESRAGSSVESAAGAVRPVCAAITSELGARLGAAYDEESVGALFERCASLFGEALGSAAPPELCSEEEWRAALGRASFFLDYQVELPLRALPRWLGVSAATRNTDAASRFLVSLDEDENVLLYYYGRGVYARCTTASTAESLRQITAELLPNGAYFAFEGGAACKDVEPDTLLLPELTEKQAITRESLSLHTALREQAAAALGISVLSSAVYSERDGTQVYVSGSGTLRFQPNGWVVFTAAEGENEEPVPDEPELIDRACALLTTLRSSYTGEERLLFDGLSSEENGERILRFAWYVDGVRLRSAAGHAVRLRYAGGRLLSLEMELCRYTRTGEDCILLPPLQAAAIAGGLEPGSALRLVYDETEAGILPVWTAE
jgi:hypothetical protein